MFKFESYITPILLSYVDKYIKNFKQEDSQVSLWGGDVSFHNLELRLEVLEQELQLPFSFASGHIHELLIHVPWTKLTSEPITITINTIECILKLRNENDVSTEAPSTSKDTRKRVGKKQDRVQTPPGYVQTVINKIVGNITIFCNNLILKYVEEDIVLSVNVKTVTLQSANNEWKPAFSEISSVDVKLRKLISLTDLTICLDKRNASGKIEMYQEPLLYRCSLDIRLLWCYLSPKAKRAKVTRIDVRCSRMDFSLTEQQVPMLMRLIFLALALHSKELNKKKNQQSNTLTDQAPPDAHPDDEDEARSEVSWTGWAWSWMPSLYSAHTYDDILNDQYAYLPGPTFHAGFYMEQASLSLKVTESSAERSFYGSRKVKFVPFLYLQLQGCMVDFVMHGSSWLNVQMGISQATLQPYGDCFCGVKEVTSEFEPKYFSSGSKQVNYVSESLFDNRSIENKGERRKYNVSWDYHLETVTEALLLERTPAVAVDYLYVIDLPEDCSSERLSELGSDLEYSNLEERALCRMVLGPLVMQLCSGLFHRLQLLHHAAKLYDYGPYSVPKPDPSREQLAPASAEDFEALDVNIPIQIFQVTLFNPQIQLLLADHPSLDPNIFHGYRKRKRSQRVQSLYQMLYKNLPRITVDCQCLDAKIVRPMYPRRLVWTTCQLPSPPKHMFDSCHLQFNVKILGVGSSLILSVERNMKVILPTNVTYKQNNILLPQYWIDPNVPHVNQKLDIESFSLTCTKAQLLTIAYIVQSICNISFNKDAINCTTLLEDTAKESGNEHLEVCMDDITYQNVLLPQTICCTIQISSIRAFVLLQSDGGPIEQIMVFSGPEGIANNKTPLVLFTMQMPSKITHHSHPPIILFHLREVHVCIDPLFINWMRYAAATTSDYQPVSDVNIVLPSNVSSTSIGQRRLRKVSESSRATTPQESVHSSSDRDQQLPVASIPKTCIEETDITECSQDEVLVTKFSWANFLEWYPVWCGLVICGDIEKCILYLPNSSLTHAGAQSIEQVLQQHNSCLEILVVCFPSINLSSASVLKSNMLSKFPVTLPEEIWSRGKINFPWSLSIADLEIYTIQNSRQLHFLKKVSVTATIALSTKYIPELNTTSPTAFCVHVDTTPIRIAVSELQVKLMACVLVDVLDIVYILSTMCQGDDEGDIGILPELPTPGPTSPTIFRESTCSQESPQTTLGTEDSNEIVSDGAKLTAWLQFTLARLTVKLYTKEIGVGLSDLDLKLVVDMEDIMTSIDIQQVYFKAKSKITSCSVQHLQRTTKDNLWKPGAYQGFVMRGLEEPVAAVSPNLHAPSVDESGGGFLRMTYTRARCNNVHSRWGSRQPITLFNQSIIAKNSHVRSISEIVVKLQAIDFILSPATLGGFLKVLEPLLLVSQNTGGWSQPVENNWIKYLNNNTLPLLYLDTKAIRIIVPAYDLCGTTHDVCMFQIDETTLSPQVKNPLGRTPLRPDIWRLAEQCRMLGMPGADVEDRQYQLDITGFSISTSFWSELDRCLSADQQQGLRTMGENPALAWNSLLGCEESIIPHLSLLPIIGRMDLCIVAAPAIVYRADTLVCGAALEVNVTTDVVISLSTHQLLLISALLSEVLILVQPFISESEENNWTNIKMRQDIDLCSKGIDSGVDCADSSLSSNRNLQDETVNKSLSKENKLRPNTSPINRIFNEDTCIKPANSGEFNKAGTNSSPNTSQNYRWTSYKGSMKECSEKGSSSHIKSNKFLIPPKQNIVPLEILLTSGTLYLMIYEQEDCVSSTLELASQWHKRFVSRISNNGQVKGKKNTTMSSANKTDKVNGQKLLLPLVHIMIAQPHTFLSNHSNEQTLQLSCFDTNIKIGNEMVSSLKSIPTMENFPFTIFETKCGDPHPTTGIPPSFLTIKWVKPTNKSPKINFEIGRPTKLCITSPFIKFMLLAETKILKMFTHFQTVMEETKNALQKTLEKYDNVLDVSAIQKDTNRIQKSNSDDDTETTPSILNEELHFEKRYSLPLSVSAISLTSQQIVISLESNNSTSVCCSVASLRASASYVLRHQGDRIIMHTSVNSFVITTSSQNSSYILLNPWSFSVKCTLAWELWSSSPQVQINTDLDCVFIDVGPVQLKCLYIIYKDYNNILQIAFQNASSSQTKYSPVLSKMCQHYRDDLRAGAFQFVDSVSETQSVNELPLPYQVVFWNKSPVMAWRYPQPRALTKVDIFPVPFKVATTSDDSSSRDQVLCCLEYWNEVKSCFLPYTQFRLSETDVCHLSMPETKDTVVACTWRVRLLLESEDNVNSNHLITLSSRSLAACMRIDSFFSPELIPSFQIVVNIASLQVSLFNHVVECETSKMPALLKDFTCDGNIPPLQCIMSLFLDGASVFLNTWPSNNKMIEATGHIKLDTIDFSFLTQKAIIEPFQFKSSVKLTDQETDVSVIVNPVHIKIGPGTVHTLGVSAQLWKQAYNAVFNPDTEQCCVIVTRYVICNDTTESVRFGQLMTDEDILLGSRQCHYYTWRSQKCKQLLHLGIQNGAWIWSQPFKINDEGMYLCPFIENEKKEFDLFVKSVSISATQKQIIISGHLSIKNLLIEKFECKVLALNDTATIISQENSVIVKGSTSSPSILLSGTNKFTLRIRLQGLETVWSGDIPLVENTKSNQPWLVKVPLPEKGQFISIWCRIVTQVIENSQKILAILSPLYMIRSHLPVPAKAFIETPGLKSQFTTTIKGKGHQQQLYCPGTIEHSHQLTFQIENSEFTSDPYVPLSYSMIDHKQFFKQESESLSDISNITSLSVEPEFYWPFVGNEYENIQWITSHQPQTHVQIKYKPQSPYSNTLLVDLQPWALLVNTVGCTITLFKDSNEVCDIPHLGVIAPPKLEGTFNIGLKIESIVMLSPPLQLQDKDTQEIFYMPRISGVIPAGGNVEIAMYHGNITCYANIKSFYSEEIRIIYLTPLYVISNNTKTTVQVATFLLKDKISLNDVDNYYSCIISLSPNECTGSVKGTPLIKWACSGSGDDDGDLILYIVFNLGYGWSYPVEISCDMPRHSFTIPVLNSLPNSVANKAFVLTTQVKEGQVFFHIYEDAYPQIVIHNQCNFKLHCGQGSKEDGFVVHESRFINYSYAIEPNSSAYYNFPYVSKRFPELIHPNALPPLVLSVASNSSAIWSQGISINEVQEQFIYLPTYGDVKVSSALKCHTVNITVETVSHVEVSAREIRTRLTQQYIASGSQNINMYKKDCNKFHYIDNISRDDLMTVHTPSDASISLSESVKIDEGNLVSGIFSQKEQSGKLALSCIFKAINISLTADMSNIGPDTEILAFYLDNVYINVSPKEVTSRHGERLINAEWDMELFVGDLQLDNQLFHFGGFDFPVILISQEKKDVRINNFFSNDSRILVDSMKDNCLIKVLLSMEQNSTIGSVIIKSCKISLGPLSAYLEDNIKRQFVDNILSITKQGLVVISSSENNMIEADCKLQSEPLVVVPSSVYFESHHIAFPVRLNSLVIDSLTLVLSLHMTAPLYIALDHSPLHFNSVELLNVNTTSYRLGHSLTMHYLSGAIFGAGWVVGSLELLGSPGGFARTLGSGLRDFVSLPYNGIFQGPWAFVTGITNGSASLMKHITAGTLSSVTKLASSIARNLDHLTLDHEHLQRREQQRRQPPQGLAQGFVQGLTGLGISLLGAVGGIAHHPLQSIVSGGSLAAGVGRGLVGVVTKPLSGAADLVALTGQGLLRGTGWTTFPQPRQKPVIEKVSDLLNSRLKYSWKMVSSLKHNFLQIIEATSRDQNGTFEAVSLVLTNHALFLVNIEGDNIQRVLSPSEITNFDHSLDPSLLCFYFQAPSNLAQAPSYPVQMDPTSHARIMDYVRQSSGLIHIVNDSALLEQDSTSPNSPAIELQGVENALSLYVNPQLRNYFISALILSKRQNQGKGFPLL